MKMLRSLELTMLAVLALAGAARGYDAANSRVPDEYAIIFNAGYASDALPQDPAQFEAVVKTCKEAGFNTILGKYTDERAAMLKKHGMKLMVDLLVEGQHIYKDVEAVAALGAKLKDHDEVYAYHLWSDRMGSQVAGRSRDIANMRQWDPRHPTYVGDYGARDLAGLIAPDIIGYYDFHWKRGGCHRHLQRVMEAANKHDVPFLKYTDAAPGLPGIGNYNRVMYTVSQSTVFGMRGYLFHYTGANLLNLQTAELGVVGKDCARVNRAIAPLGPELMKLGNPQGVYSTPVTRSANDRPVTPAALPEALVALPEDFPVSVISGEVLIGDYVRNGARVLLVANHNAYKEQPDVKLKLKAAFKKVSRFDRQKGGWDGVGGQDGVITFPVAPAGLEMLKLE